MNLNAGPVTRYQIEGHNLEISTSKRIYFIHIDIYSFTPKCSKAALIGITETKLDETAYNSGVTVNGYNMLWNDTNEKGLGVACYIRNNIRFSSIKCLSDNIENLVMDPMFPKIKPISIGVT